MTINTLLQGSAIRLTAITPDDMPAIASWYEDTQFMRLLQAEPAMPRTAAAIESYLKEQQKSPTAFPLAIRLADRGDLIGYLEINGILWNQRTAWIAIAIGETNQRKRGYGTESMQLALDFAFKELNLRRVQLSVFGYNEPAIALYEKLGFVREGTFREFLLRDGQTYDMYTYGLLAREWET